MRYEVENVLIAPLISPSSMQQLAKGTYFGSNYQKSVFDGFIITDTQYTHKHVDWHRHENPYFTYLLQGKLYEANKKQEHYLTSGGLLFHNWQDSHYNSKPDDFTRGFHVELNAQWFKQHDLPLDSFEGSHLVENPKIKSLMNLVFMESKISDAHSQLSIDGLMLTVFNQLIHDFTKIKSKQINWIEKLAEMVTETSDNHSLTSLSDLLGVHPVHLSREFHHYFGMTFGQYIRYVRVNKAFNFILNTTMSMTDICYQCGFYDQSHFIRDFKRIYQKTPGEVLVSHRHSCESRNLFENTII